MPALALIVVGTFAGHAVAGPNGLLAWGGYHRDLETRKVELASLEAERDQLRHRSALLDPRKADPDLADEMVRRTSAWSVPTRSSFRSNKLLGDSARVEGFRPRPCDFMFLGRYGIALCGLPLL